MKQSAAGERCPKCGAVIAPPLRGQNIRIVSYPCHKCGALVTITKAFEEPIPIGAATE